MNKRSFYVKDFNELMKHCKKMMNINYIEPTIHVGSGAITTITIYLHGKSENKTICAINKSDDFDFKKEIYSYLDSIDWRLK